MSTMTELRCPIILLVPWSGGDPLHPTPEMERIQSFGNEVYDGLDAEGINMECPRPLRPGATRFHLMTLWGKPPWLGDQPVGIKLTAWDETERVQEAMRRVLADSPVAVAQVLFGQEADDHYRKEVQ